MKIDIEVIGTHCNTWPTLVLEINNDKVYCDTVKSRQKISVEYKSLKQQGNKLVIGMTNKSFGGNGVWDTVSKNNVVIEDKTIELLSLKLDDVDCKDLFKNRFYVKRTDKQPSYFPDVIESIGVMNYNGYFSFDFDLPLYGSIINKKFKQDTNKDLSYFSNYTKVFHYEEEIKVINEINAILKEVDEKFSDKRSKIRNS
jgi:hypothetical protein